MDQNKDSGASGEPPAESSRDEGAGLGRKKAPEGQNDEWAGAPEPGKDPPQEQRERRSLSWYAQWATIIGVPLGILVAVLIAVFTGGSEISVSAVSGGPPGSPRLERVDLIARNSVSPNRPGLELLVRNGGDGRSVVSRARIEILRVYPVPLCFTQGALPVSERYGVELPPDAAPGEIVEVPLHQQVARNAADRFAIDIGVDSERIGKVDGPGVAEALGVESGDGTLPGLYMFEVGVALVHDGRSNPLPMGTALVSAPEMPLSSEYVLETGELKQLTETFLTYGDLRDSWGRQLACWQANGRTVERARTSEATRSADLEDILSTTVVPRWSELEG